MSANTGIEWTDALKARFWSYIQIGEANECWLWKGAKNQHRYGMLRIKRIAFMSHRLSLELKLGRPLNDGMCCCHRCDNPSCCNPIHLFEGTQAENLRDCRSKNRAFLKLSDADVKEIQHCYKPRIVTLAQLGRRFGVTKNQIHHIVTGRQRKAAHGQDFD